MTASSDTRRFQIRVDKGFRPFFAVLGLGPRHDWVEVRPDELVVRMGWAFAATIPRTSIRSAGPHKNVFGGWGVHGWRGRWLVNGSSKGIVEIEVADGARGRVLGVPVRLKQLLLSLDDPAGLLAALGSPA